MWLLNTSTPKPREFVSPEAVEEGYATFSHVWDSQEQTFDELRKIQEKHADYYGHLSPKITKSCKDVKEQGYRWACIDPLPEAINSMFH
ncbi:hypothetical protein C8Q74DRAFT_1391499 [Fomes fomentarius]|nr:hypothetical protein C8Q74DRAFT_1391499 [Fomes fomentarius]